MEKKIDLSPQAKLVLEKRYLKKNEKGELIETPFEMFERVARVVSNVDRIYNKDIDIEKIYESFLDVMVNLEFLPNSPTLMNAGRDLGQLSACFLKDQEIITPDGFKKISDININDLVLTSDGLYRRVTEKFKRKDDTILKIKVAKLTSPTLKVTREHPIFGLKKGESKLRWIKAEELKKGDYVAISYPKYVIDVDSIDVENYIDGLKILKNGGFIEKGIVRKETIKYEGERKDKRTLAIRNRIKFDGKFLRFIGYYISEGNIDKSGEIRFTFNKKEKEKIEDLSNLVVEIFGIKPSIKESNHGNWVTVRFFSTIVSIFLKNLIGTKFNNKRLPNWMLTLPIDKQLELLKGIFLGDGFIYKEKRKLNLGLTLANKTLMYQIYQILLRLGVFPSIKVFKHKLSKNKTYRIDIKNNNVELIREIFKVNVDYNENFSRKIYKIKDGFLLFPILDIKRVKRKGGYFVYNLEVEEKHTYVANFVAVHNCFVLPVGDSLNEIFDAVKYAALIHQSGGGTGFSFSKLRPKGDIVKSTMGVASGPISFMEVFDKATETIKQGGVRRGANMGILRVDHPDILDFILSKDKPGTLTNFNISVAITDHFMKKYFNDEEYELINPRDGRVVKKLRAREVFDLIVEHAWKTGDPGVIFIDNINKANSTPHLGEIESTNPCGEQPLLPYESCNLGSIDVSKFIKDGKIDYDRLGKVVHIAVHFLDNVIDINRYPVQKIEEMTKLNRKIGLGIMGFHDLLIKLRIPYDSEDAVKIAEELMSFISEKGLEKSEELAKSRGVFPAWKGSIFEKSGKMVRNATITTIAPTGSISIIANCSSGIEPIFALAYKRQVAIGEWYEINPLFEKELKERGIYSEELMDRVCEEGSVRHFDDIPEDIKRVYVTAHDIEPEWHLKIQAAFQKYVDNAVSKTVNLRNEAKVEDVKKIYLMAYKLGLKGVTIYRDRSKDVQVLIKGQEEKKEAKGSKLKPRPRPSITYGATIKMKTGCGNLYVTINEDENGICEVFSTLGKAGGCAASQTEGISRLISLALRSGVSPEPIIEQLKGIRCPNPIWQDGEKILSCADAIAKALEKYLSMKIEDKKILNLSEELGSEEKIKDEKPQIIEGIESPICPECGSFMISLEGCWSCPNCGYSKCD